MGCDIWLSGSQPNLELQKLACTIRIGQTDFSCFTPESEDITDKTRYVDLRWIEATGYGAYSFEEKKEISKYYDGRITGAGESWEGMWFDNLNEGRIVTSTNPTRQRKPDTLYLTSSENVRLRTGDVSHFIEAFIIRQRCIPNLLLSDDYHYSFSLYYFYCVCGGKKRVATAKPGNLYRIKQEIASIVQVLSDNYSGLNTLNLQNISQKYSNDGYFASLDRLLEDMQEISQEKVECLLKHEYIERLIRKHLDEHYQSLSNLSVQEKRLVPIRDLLLPLDLEIRLINELKIYTIGDLLDSFHFEAFSQTSNIRIANERVVNNFQEYELKIHKELFGLDLRSQLNASAGQLLILCNILTIVKAI